MGRFGLSGSEPAGYEPLTGGMMTEAMDRMERGRGRPRDIEKDVAIRDAFWSVLAARGYDGLTFEAIADMAACSRATLYRRFASKLELIVTILDETSRAVEPALPDDVDPRDAFRAHAAGAAAYMSGERGPAILSLTEAAARIPDLKRAMEPYKIQEREFYFDAFRKLVPGAGEAWMAFAFDAFVGTMVHTIIVEGRTLSDEERERIVDMIIHMLGR